MRSRAPPAERVRARVARTAGVRTAALLPRGYQRLGRVLVVRLPESLRPAFAAIGEAWRAELGVTSVLRHAGRTDGEDRTPRMELIAGESAETELRENGLRYRLDAARLMFAAGNRTERRREGAIVRPDESVVDLFAGIGYFAIPAAAIGQARSVLAVERNPLAHRFLVENIHLNRLDGRVHALLGDNRAVHLPSGGADRVFLGFLPSALPWVDRAIEVVKPGGALHVHLVAGVRHGREGAAARVGAAVRAAGVQPERLEAREVKPYGPGNAHYVVDVTLGTST
ncbi:MAG TPA: class I SAM-dependent methyltransferase family protein [Thermoplasmata archaeon]|nr:class I SAM-dependent methyltransferase family protein [Thermoplasmata archaeon]